MWTVSIGLSLVITAVVLPYIVTVEVSSYLVSVVVWFSSVLLMSSSCKCSNAQLADTPIVNLSLAVVFCFSAAFLVSRYLPIPWSSNGLSAVANVISSAGTS